VRYPVLSRSKCEELAQKRLDGFEPAVDQDVQWLGTGAEIPLDGMEKLGTAFAAEANEWTDPDKDRFEGRCACRLYQVLLDKKIPTEVLDDPGLWRFLTMKYFWPFVAWREEKPFSKGNFMKYIDGNVATETVLTRMYLRAQALGGGEVCRELAGAIPHATDFWRSHVIRVRTGTAVPLTRAFVRRQAEERLNTDPIRAVARRLNRTWTNVVLNLYDEAEAEDIINHVWDTGGNA
jgi:hypothetical protein